MAITGHHGRMDPLAILIAHDVQRRLIEGAQPPRRRTRRPAARGGVRT
jgi:hypothetical protein